MGVTLGCAGSQWAWQLLHCSMAQGPELSVYTFLMDHSEPEACQPLHEGSKVQKHSMISKMVAEDAGYLLTSLGTAGEVGGGNTGKEGDGKGTGRR